MKDWLRLIVIAILTFGLFACSSSEEKAQTKFSEINQQEQAEPNTETESKYRQLIADFPGTRAALNAQEQLAQLHQQKSSAEKQHAYAAIKSIPRVVQGYKSFYHHWPQSMLDFDNGDYFFDSNYLVESVAKGFTAYLALTDADPGFRLWSLPESSAYSYRLTEDGKNLIETEKNQMLAEIEENYQVEAQKGALVFLVPKAVSK